MRRSLLAIPAVVALGAGGFYLWHHETAAPPATSTSTTATTTTTPGAASVQAHGAAKTITTGDGRVIAAPDNHPAGTAQPGGEPSSVARPGKAEASNDPAHAVSPAAPAGTRDFLRTAPGPNGSAATTEKQPPVPMPGMKRLQNKLRTRAACQGPDAEREYAALTGDARRSFAEGCQRAGITLPP